MQSWSAMLSLQEAESFIKIILEKWIKMNISKMN